MREKPAAGSEALPAPPWSDLLTHVDEISALPLTHTHPGSVHERVHEAVCMHVCLCVDAM